MNILARRAIALGAFAAALLPAAASAQAPHELHGSADAFAVPGMALAWGVLRGGTEETTIVVVRIVTDPAVFSRVAAKGSDPFTERQLPLLAATPVADFVELRLPRSHFAAFPRTEIRFLAPGSLPSDPAASLLVFYLGVPDTTPEFMDTAKLDAYLRTRIAQLRGGTPP